MKKLALVTLSSLLVSTAAYAGDSAAVCHMLSARAAMVGDVNAQPMPGMPDMIRVPVSADMAKQLSAGWPAGTPADGTTLEVHRDGKVMFSGQDVTTATTTLCASVPNEETPKAVAQHTHKTAKAKHNSAKTASSHHKGAKQKEASEPNEMPTAAEAPVTQQAVPAPAEMPAMKADDTAAAPAAAVPAPAGAMPAPAATATKAAPPALEAPVSNNPFATDAPAATAPPAPPATNSPMTVGKPMGQQAAPQPSDANKPAAWPAPNAQ